MSKSAEIHRQCPPFWHPVIKGLPPSKAARFVAEAFPGKSRGQRTIVDSGCGEGRNTLFLLDKGFCMVAVDASERNLRILSKKAAEAGVAPGTFQCVMADIVEGIPIEDSAADAVLDVWVLGSVIIPHDGRVAAKQYLAEVHRILKPGGLFVSEFETIRPRRSAEDLKKYLSGFLGRRFSIVASEAITTDYASYVVVPRRIEPYPAVFVAASKE